MVDYTRPATWDDVKTLARYLADEEVEYALIGGYAIAAHGFSRFSEDVDILVNPTRENTARWIRACSRLPDGAARELAADSDFFDRDAQYARAKTDSGPCWPRIAPPHVAAGRGVRAVEPA